MAVKGIVLLLLPLLQGASADWTTTITANLIVPNTATPVVDYVTTSPGSTPTVTPPTSMFLSFDPARSHTEHFTSVVTILDGKIPTIRFSPCDPFYSFQFPFCCFTCAPSELYTYCSTRNFFHQALYKRASCVTEFISWKPVENHTVGFDTYTSWFDWAKYSTWLNHAKSSKLFSGWSGLPGSSTTPYGSFIPTVAPSDQLTSADLTSASDLGSLPAHATGSDSAIGIYAPTGSPSSEPWGTLTILPSGTITGTPAITDDASIIAGLLKNSYNNIDELEKDPKSYKKHIEDIEDQSEDYLSKTDFDSSKSPCSSSNKRSLRKRDLFSAVGDLASEAASATVDTAKDIADAAISCVHPIADEIISEIPDDPEDVTDDIKNQVKKGTEYLDEISNIVENMEEKLKDDEDDSSSESQSSESSTSSCQTSATFSECTWSTIISSMPASASASMTTTSTEVCTTRTACNASPTTMSTTTTIGACSRRTIAVSAPAPVPITPSDYTGTAVPGPSVSAPLTSSVPSTTPPSSASGTTPTGSPTTTPSPTCRAYYNVDQKHGYSYCLFDCDAYTGTYPIVEYTSGMSGYQPCPYSKPPASTWSPSNAGPFTTTASDGTVYSCGDSSYENANINHYKSCMTSMSSVTVISSIYSSWSASQSSAASAASASRASVSASEASASSASAAAATPTDQIYIAYEDPLGGMSTYWQIFHVDMDVHTIDWCDTEALGAADASDDISLGDVPNPPTISFGDDAAVEDDTFKDCTYDGDSATLNCPNFSVECRTDMEGMGTETCYDVLYPTDYVPKVWCAWGPADTTS
ncbi:hypothetical protein BDV59DRAFT_205553 [Aspergillus ambiguus]|uniref:uncharacterized protein n=1 Tax=Aspergillus ambiguus TaxID=176160 RepID=UPI003CCDFA2C